MAKEYRKIDLYERRKIEEGLKRGESCSEIARALRRSPSNITREVRENRTPMGRKEKRSACKWQTDALEEIFVRSRVFARVHGAPAAM